MQKPITKKNNKWTPEYVRYCLYLNEMLNVGSLNSPLSSEEPEAELLEFIPDENPDVYEKVDEIFRHEFLVNMIEGLTDREQYVVNRRFGFYDGHIYTLEEIGQELHITRERVRQIEAKALRKLRVRMKLKRIYSAEEV